MSPSSVLSPACLRRITEAMKADSIVCRLCAARANFVFSRTGDDGVAISCYACAGCDSLQTEEPYWIDALYANSSGASNLGLDVWAVDRCMNARIATALLWKLGRFTSQRDRLLDWGGGPGLLVRMLRDIGINAFLYDKYSPNHYATGFTRSETEHYSFITAFEVFEHFANPATDLEPILAMNPRFLLVSTCLYRGQGPDWAYLGPPKSEHVFFYSEKALHLIAQRFGYEVCLLPGEITLFYQRPLSTLRLRLVGALLAKPYLAQLAFAAKRKWSLGPEDDRTIRRRLQQSESNVD
jgi:hypothetical protein